MDCDEEERAERRELRLRESDRQAKELLSRRNKRKEEKLAEPFALLMARRLFWLELVLALGFGVLDGWRLISGSPGFSAAQMLGSLLFFSAFAGLPVLAICAVQFFRHSRGAQLEGLSLLRRYGLASAVLLAALGLGALVCRLAGL